MENPKQQLIERLQSANNVLITVSTNPSVDQLSAAIGLTLLLNKLDKHATAVFSGEVPSTIEFLQPEKTLEKNTDSLRDFIISLDKSKADKLRYKVEDSHVKIFITPYRTSITEDDLNFSQGDFNVELIVALGVSEQRDLDHAITAHGRILHDATTASVTTGMPSTLGTINWIDGGASSLGEMVASLADIIGKDAMDGQIATALMTGIVAETQRFSNEKTSPLAMSLSASLMAAGANQQLVATNLAEPVKIAAEVDDAPGPEPTVESPEPVKPAGHDGSLQITHDAEETPAEPSTELPQPEETPEAPVAPQQEQSVPESQSIVEGGSSLILDPPSLGGKLTANSEPEHLDPSIDPLSGSMGNDKLLSRSSATSSSTEPVQAEPEPSTELPQPEETPEAPVESTQPEEPAELDLAQLSSDSTDQLSDEATNPDAPEAVSSEQPVVDNESAMPQQTLSDLEAAVQNAVQQEAEITNTPAPGVDNARDAVSDALASIQDEQLPPIQALNAQDVGLTIDNSPQPPQSDTEFKLPEGAEFSMPENLVPPAAPPVDDTAASVSDPTAPPVVPPPFMPGIPGFDTPQLDDNDSQNTPQK